MKKRFITIGLIILLAVLLLIGAMMIFNPDTDGNAGLQSDSTTVAFANAQLGITVDDWLKIIELDEYNGRLAVVAENISDSDVEYALLTVKTKNQTLTFNISAFLRGTKAVLLCNEAVGSNPDETYAAWEIKDKVVFEKPPAMYKDVFEAQVTDGSISLKNISGKDIESDIYICYKDKNGDVLNGSITYRVRVAGIKADSQTFVKAEEYNENNCQIIFIDYDD